MIRRHAPALQDELSETGPPAECSSYRDEALRLNRLFGWTCIPWRSEADGTKRPACGWKHLQRDRPAAAADVAGLFDHATAEVNGLAVVTGAPSGGLVVADFDDAAAYGSWRSRNPSLAAELPTSRTGRGYHVFARAGAEVYGQLAGGAGQLHGDRRHVAILPHSLHCSGRQYEWVVGPVEPPPLIDPRGAFPIDGRKFAARCKFNDAGPVQSSTIGGIVAECVPTRAGVRNHLLWRMAVRLRSMPGMRDAPFAAVEPILLGWFDLAVGSPMRTKDFAVSLADFARQWEATLTGATAHHVLLRALGDALARPLPPDPWPDASEPARLLVALAGELQRVAGPGGTWPLACRDAAAVCHHADFKAAHRHLAKLVLRGLLSLASAGQPRPGGSGVAHRYVVGPRWEG